MHLHIIVEVICTNKWDLVLCRLFKKYTKIQKVCEISYYLPNAKCQDILLQSERGDRSNISTPCSWDLPQAYGSCY